MEMYCKYCGALLEGEVHVFEERFFCDYDCLESYVVANTEIEDIKAFEEYNYVDLMEEVYCNE